MTPLGTGTKTPATVSAILFRIPQRCRLFGDEALLMNVDDGELLENVIYMRGLTQSQRRTWMQNELSTSPKKGDVGICHD